MKNIGEARATCPGTCNQEIFFYVNNVNVGEDNYDNLDPNQIITLESPRLTAPSAGSHAIRAKADANNEVPESRESNNELSESFTTQSAAEPDLIVEDIWTEPASPVEGTSYRVKARVKNIGEARATCPGTCNQEIFFYVNNVNVGEDNYDNLDPNQIITLESPRLTAPSAGSHAIRAKADANNEVPESRESNNELSESFTTQSAAEPDLIVEDIWTEPASPVEGTSYRVKARVKNIGKPEQPCPGPATRKYSSTSITSMLVRTIMTIWTQTRSSPLSHPD